MSDQKQEQEATKQEEQVQPQKVELTAEQYNALLDRIAELEALALKQQSQPVVPPSSQEYGTSEEAGVDIDQMSPRELVQFINEQVSQIGQQLLVEIQTLKVQREIDKCEAKYPDFWDYEEAIRAIAMENPTLSIEQAYKLAKQQMEEEARPKKAEATSSVTQRILKLPPKVVPGEKPSTAPSATRKTEPRTLREAAERAWEDIAGGKPEV